MTGFSKLLKHLGINKKHMIYDMQSRISDYEKPYLVENCKHFETCKKGQLGCRGCNIWNLFYDTNALKEWCIENGKSFSETVDELEQNIVR